MRASHSLFTVLAVLGLDAAATPAFAALEWEATSLPAAFEYALAAGPDGQVIAIGGGVVHRSLDDGATWSPMGPFVANAFARHAAFAASGALVASDFAFGVFRSDDDGASWSPSLVDEGCNGLAVSPEGVMFAGLTYTGNGKVHRSADGGANWTPISLPGATQSFSTECFAFGDSGEVYAGTIDGFYRSPDHGLTWQRCNAGLGGLHVRTMAVAPDQKLYIQTLFPSLVDGVYRSSDRGHTWTRLDVGHPYYADLAAAPGGEMLGVEEGEVFVSRDEGLSWASESAGIGEFEQLGDVLVTPSGRILVGGRRVYRSAQALLDAGSPSLPAEILLAAPAPNPARREARIGFTLAASGRVRLVVHDVAGREVAVLADGVFPAGSHAARLETRGLAAGVYLCRLSASGRHVTRRLAVLP